MQLALTAVFTAVVLLTAYSVQKRVLPLIKTYAQSAAKAEAAKIIYSSVNEVTKTASYSDFYRLCRGGDGKINSIEINTPGVNEIRAETARRVAENIQNSKKLQIPLGAVLNHIMFSGTGPKIPVTLASTGFTEADIESSFKSGGINQTVHSVSMRVKTTVNVILPYGITSVSLETAVPVTETVIVGNVPDIFAGNSPLR